MELMPEQVECVDFIMQAFKTYQGALNASGMGTGKTAVAIEIIKRTTRPCLVVCPAYIVPNWVRQLALWGASDNICVIDSSKQIIRTDAKIYLTSYNMITQSRYEGKKKIYPVFNQLMKFDLSLLVCDESHALKTLGATRTRLIIGNGQNKKHNLRMAATRTILLTGTPVLNRLEELYSLVKPIAPAALNNLNKFDFMTHFSASIENTPWGIKYHGVRYVEELKAMLSKVMVRKTKIEGLPPLQVEDITISARDPKVKKALQIEEDWLKTHNLAPDDLDEIQRLGALEGATLAALRQQSAILKIPTAMELIADLIEKEQKILVFCHHQAVQKAIFDKMTAAGIKTGAVTGAIPIKNRVLVIEAMQSGELQAIAATMESLREGIDLQAVTSIIFIENSWVPATMQQCIARSWRKGQEKHVTIYFVNFNSGIDKYILGAVRKKTVLIDAIIV